MMWLNRVGDLALSATGTGSCPEDEGNFCDGVTAPAAHIGRPPLCCNDTRSGEWSAVFDAVPYGC